MSREFPDIVDPWKAADGKRSFHGTMPMKRMGRLEAMLAPSADNRRGEAAFELHFAYDEQGLVTIDVAVKAELPLICQRSLQPFVEQVERHSLLVVIEHINEQESVPESYEPILVEGRRLAPVDIVEEELILAVPQVPKSPESEEIELSTDGEVKASSAEMKEPTHRPFEGLAGLMKENVKE